jgi:hypothetical protein
LNLLWNAGNCLTYGYQVPHNVVHGARIILELFILHIVNASSRPSNDPLEYRRKVSGECVHCSIV